MAWKRDGYLYGRGTHLACHAHGAWFDIETGDCVQGPCLGKRLIRVPLTVHGDGLVRITPTERKARTAAHGARAIWNGTTIDPETGVATRAQAEEEPA